MTIIVWLEENINKKGKDGMEGRNKINQQFTGRKVAKHIAGQTTGRRMRITKKIQIQNI